jgi:plastocyanin
VITAMNIAFTEQTVQAPASAPFTIDFRNGDAGTPHNVAIKDSTGAQIFKGDIVTGVTEVKYQVPALAPGTYQFVCDVHPNMTGTLKVGG